VPNECINSNWGPEFSDEEIESYIKKFKIKAVKSEEIA
jgi:hypothetical protein